MSSESRQGKVYTVDRGAPKRRGGQGMLGGMGVVWKHFRDALTSKLDNPSETSGVFTVQYPEEREQLPEATRNFPILLYEDESGQELCTSCFQCERICPPQVIHITQAKDPATGKPVPAVAAFDIEYDACMSCGLCAEVCPFDAIKMDHTFEIATAVHSDLTVERADLDRPVSYYQQLAPRFWAEVEESALKKLQNAVKRRPGLIGVAPAMVEQARARQAITPAPALAAPAPAAEPALEAAPAEAKAAKLAAIRAANAAQKAGEAGAAPSGQATPAQEAAQPVTPAEAKAAKLAAIRAANAAQKPAAEPQAGPNGHPAQPEPPQPATPAEPADSKAAKLAAIRAANAAKKSAAADPASATDAPREAPAPASDQSPEDIS